MLQRHGEIFQALRVPVVVGIVANAAEHFERAGVFPRGEKKIMAENPAKAHVAERVRRNSAGIYQPAPSCLVDFQDRPMAHHQVRGLPVPVLQVL